MFFGCRLLLYPKRTETAPIITGGVRRYVLLAALAVFGQTPMAGETMLLIDDRSTGDYRSLLDTEWRLITDGVMGGVSSGRLETDEVEGRPCLRLRGEVSLENNGGFIQAALDLGDGQALNAWSFTGVMLDVFGNDENYNLHLRTSDVWLPWQSYRASFRARPAWQTIRLPFSGFEPYRIGKALNLRKLERIGVLAIGRSFTADLCVGRVVLY
jgi:hypothetical protein